MPNSVSRSKRKESGTSLHFPARAMLFDSHHPPRRVYLLCSGQVKLSSGRDAVVGYIARGDFFGEKSFLTPRRAGQIAEALSPVKVSAFRKSELLACLQRDRRFALRVLRNLTLRLDRTEEMIHAFVTDPAERRLARLLLRFVPASAVSGWVRLRFSPSNADLGKTIGTTRWRIAHFMRHFQDLGWLIRRHGLVVRSEGLREFLELRRRNEL